MINSIMLIAAIAQPHSHHEVGKGGSRCSVSTPRFDLSSGLMVGYAVNQGMMSGRYDWGWRSSKINPSMMDIQAIYFAPMLREMTTNPRVAILILVSAFQWFCVPSFGMAPKRKSGLTAASGSGSMGRGGTKSTPVKKRSGQGRATRAQSRAQEAAHFFHNRLPSPVRDELECIEKRLWDSVKEIPVDELRSEVEDWVVDPGTTAGRATAYDRMVMLYWVTKNLLAHAIMTNMVKAQGDEEPVRAWKDHNVDSRLMHLKIDAIAKKIGLTFFDPRRGAEEQLGPGAWRPNPCRHHAGPSQGGGSSGTLQQMEDEALVEPGKGKQHAMGKDNSSHAV